MTHITGLSGLNMGGGLAHGSGAIVAIGTTAGHCCVINTRHRTPGRRTVADFTGACRLNMAYRFTCSGSAIMATVTGAGNSGMIHPSPCPGNCSVANITGLIGLNMCDRLTNGK